MSERVKSWVLSFACSFLPSLTDPAQTSVLSPTLCELGVAWQTFTKGLFREGKEGLVCDIC